MEADLKLPAVIIDVNGCLSDTSNRAHFIADRDNRDWEGFFEHMMTDTPIDIVHRFCNAQSDHPFYSKVILTTGGPERYRPLMEKWLEQNQVYYDRLYMRGDRQYVKGFEFKRRLCVETLMPEFDLVLALDDKQECADMYRALGIPCWVTDKCTYERAPVQNQLARPQREPHYRDKYREKYRRPSGRTRIR